LENAAKKAKEYLSGQSLGLNPEFFWLNFPIN
jgi:hypothetical protein